MPEQKNKSQSIILTAAGEPFKKEQAAKLTLANKGLSETHEVIEYENGYAIALRLNEKPVDTTEVAEQQKEPVRVLCPTCGHKTTEHKYGDECANPRTIKGEKCYGIYGDDPSLIPEKYFWVKFAGKSHANDYEDVELSVNGQQLKIQRDKEVCIPGSFREAAMNAKRQMFKTVQGKGRKDFAPVLTFPFSDIREGTYEEYLSQKREGDEKTRQHIARHGFDAAPID